MRSGDILARIERHSLPEPNSGCWLWLGSTNGKGYGLIYNGVRGCTAVHRIAYEILRGPIPDGLELDHGCRTRCCWNPDHLEPVTHAENVRRRPIHPMAAKTHCKHGHEFTVENTGRGSRGERKCLTCSHEYQRMYYRNKRSAA